jgi:hypothetical protein
MKKVRVTDHAVLRFIERFVGLDVESIRTFIENEVRPSAELGATYLHREHVIYVLEHNATAAAVTTVLPRRKK